MGLGLCYAGWVANNVLSRSIPSEIEKKDVEVQGKIGGLVRTVSYGTRFEFRVDKLSYASVNYPSPGIIRLTSYNPAIVPKAGEKWHFVVRLKRARGMQNPGAGFNYETALFQQRIRATGYIVSGRQESDSENRFWEICCEMRVAALRADFANFLKYAVNDPTMSAVLTALTVGIRSDMDKPSWELLQNTGTVHLVAISGLHIGLISGMTAFIFGFFWRLRAKWCLMVPSIVASAFFSLAVALVYSLLAGFTLPTRRAFCAMCVVVASLVSRRQIYPQEVLVRAMFLVLIIDPLAPFTTSFWLSFTAVTVIVMSVFSKKEKSDNARGVVLKIIRGAFKWSNIQFWLLLGTLPVLLLGFQKVSLAAPLANLIAVPLIGMAVVPLALLALLFWSCGMDQAAQGLIASGTWVLEIVWIYLVWLAEQPWITFKQGSPPIWEVLMALAGIGILFLGKALPGRWLGYIFFLPLFFSQPREINHGDFSFTLLDVGQGLASVVQTRSRTLVYDTGAKYPSGFDLGEVVVIPYLRSIGVRKIDKLIISHGDNDHVGGATAVLQQFTVDALILGPSDNPLTSKANERCRAGQSWHWDGVKFEFLWPLKGFVSEGNNASCVLKIVSKSGSILLSGDIEKESERILVRQYDETLDSDILLAPHHGSKTSSSSALLEAVKPNLALVSAGYKSRFGHPHVEVMSRYKNLDIPVLNTADEGAISLRFSGGRTTVSGQRNQAWAFWQEPGIADFEKLDTYLNQRRNNYVNGTIDGNANF